MAFPSWFFFIALDVNSSAMRNRKGESRWSVSCSRSLGKAIAPFGVIQDARFSKLQFSKLRKFPSFPSLLRMFIMEVIILLSPFYVTIEMILSMWQIIYWFSFIRFLNYILLIMLLQLSWFFPLCLCPPRTPHSLRQSPHHCSCSWVMQISSLATPFPILYFTFLWLFCNYLFVLYPLTLFIHSPTTTSHLATIKMFSISILSLFYLFGLVWFLDSIVDRYIFLPFYHS